MQERRERLKQRALAKKQQQPRRAVSALPILDAQTLLLELEDDPSEEPLPEPLQPPPQPPPPQPPFMDWDRVLCPSHPHDALPQAAAEAEAAAAVPSQAGASLRRSSSCANSPPLANRSRGSRATLRLSASRHAPSVPRLAPRRRRLTQSPSRARTDAAGGLRAAWSPGHDSRSSGPMERLRLRRGKRAPRAEAKAGELLAGARPDSEDPDLTDVQSSDAGETALKVLGAVVVLSPTNSGNEDASEATGSAAAAHLLVDSSQRSKFLPGVQVVKRGKDLNTQNCDHSTADEISIKFVSTTVGSSVTISSENTNSNSTDIPVVAVTRNSLHIDSFNTHPVEVGSDQPDFIRTDTSRLASSCNELCTAILCNRRNENSIFNHSNTLQCSDGSPTPKSSYLMEPSGVHYTDKSLRKLDEKFSREVAMIHASKGKRHASKTFESKRQQCIEQLTSLPFDEMYQKSAKSCSSRHSEALAQCLPLDEDPTVNTPTQNDEFLYLAPSNDRTLRSNKNESDKLFTDVCLGNHVHTVEASRLSADLQFNYPEPSHSRLNGTDCNSSYSSQMHSQQVSTGSSSVPVASQPVANDHSFAPTRKTSLVHSSIATSDTSCRIRSRKLAENCARRRRHFFTIPEIPPYRGSSQSNDINRSNGDENHAKRRSQQSLSRTCENGKPVTSKPSPSMSVLKSLISLGEMENLRPVSSSLVISPPTAFASPVSSHTRPCTPSLNLDDLGSTEGIRKLPGSENVVVESSFIAPRTKCVDVPSANITPLLERAENFGVELRTTEYFPSLIPSPGSSSSSCHYSSYVPAPQYLDQSQPPSYPSSTLKKLCDFSSALSTTIPEASRLSPQPLSSDPSRQPCEDFNRISNQPPFQSLDQSESEATVLMSSMQLAEVKRNEKAVHSHDMPRGCVPATDNARTDLSEASRYSVLESDNIIKLETLSSEIIISSELGCKISQPVSINIPESQINKENSVQETIGMNETDSSFDGKTTTSELTVIRAPGLDTSDSTIQATSSEFFKSPVLPAMKTCKDVRSRGLSISTIKSRPFREKSEPVVALSQRQIPLETSFNKRGRGGKARRSSSKISNISQRKSKTVSKTSVLSSSLSRTKLPFSPRIVSKLQDRKETYSLKLKSQSVATLIASSPSSDFMYSPGSSLKLKYQATPLTEANNTLLLTSRKVSKDLTANSEISKQVELPTSDSKVLGEIVSNFITHQQQTASTMHSDITNHVPKITSDIKVVERGTSQPTPKELDTVFTPILDQNRLNPKADILSELKGRGFKNDSQITDNDVLSVVNVKYEHFESPTCKVDTMSPKHPAKDRPTSTHTDDSKRRGTYAALMACLSRHEKLLRGAAARRGLTCTLPATHHQNDNGPATYKAYLRSLRQHLELVRLVCPAEQTDTACNGMGNAMQPTVSRLRLIPVEANAV